MATPESCAVALARIVFLLKDAPEAKVDLQAAFETLIDRFGTGPHEFGVRRGAFLVDGTRCDIRNTAIEALHGVFWAHGVGDLVMPAGTTPGLLASLVRALASPPPSNSDVGVFQSRLQGLGATTLKVSPLPVTGKIEGLLLNEIDLKPPIPRTAPPAIPRGHRPVDEEDTQLTGLGADAVSEEKFGMMHFMTLEMPVGGNLGDLTSQLEADQGTPADTDFMGRMLAAGEQAAASGSWQDLLNAAVSLIRHEEEQPEGDGRRSFGLALRRLLPRRAIEQIARLSHPLATRNDAILVLRRMGAESTEVLLELLIAARSPGERRSYFNALTKMTEGTKLLVNMLTHDEWFVLRNVAELCGEMRLEDAVVPLNRLMTHEDERVRRAVVGALARIGTSGTVEPLRKALTDPSAQVRLQAVAGVDAKRARGLVGSLIKRLDEEPVDDVKREILLALGRVASPEALTVVAKAAEPGGRLLKRKPVAYRLAAVEAFRLAGPSAANYLKSLLDDDDAEVAAAAKKALANMW
jgi:HEAT repeat protein